MRLIDADRLKGYLYENYVMYDHTLADIDAQPTVDAEPVKHGHWIFNPKDVIEMMFTLPRCSECGAESPNGGNYCPNCGAKMDGERKEDAKTD